MANDQIIADLLHTHGLKNTPIRAEMLDIFMHHGFALSASDVMAKMSANYDRVTIYRALASFEAHGILHKASNDASGSKYALCDNHCPDKPHSEEHAHFVCDNCQQTYCMPEVQVPKPSVSKDFSVDKVTYTLGGLCKECKSASPLPSR